MNKEAKEEVRRILQKRLDGAVKYLHRLEEGGDAKEVIDHYADRALVIYEIGSSLGVDLDAADDRLFCWR